MFRLPRVLRAAAWIAGTAGLATMAHHAPAEAQRNRAAKLEVGDRAVLYETIDEFERDVDMADMIVDRPLVLVTGSAT